MLYTMLSYMRVVPVARMWHIIQHEPMFTYRGRVVRVLTAPIVVCDVTVDWGLLWQWSVLERAESVDSVADTLNSAGQRPSYKLYKTCIIASDPERIRKSSPPQVYCSRVYTHTRRWIGARVYEHGWSLVFLDWVQFRRSPGQRVSCFISLHCLRR